MEHEQSRRLGKRCVILIVIGVLIVIGAVVLGLTLKSGFKSTFLSRCEKFNQHDCKKLWDLFEKAYVNKDPCKVPVEAYNPLIAAAPFKPQCNKMMFWSKTKDVVHGLTAKRKDCFVTLEDTLLGSVLDDLTWCGKEGSKDTFTAGCPEWSECVNNPVRSFWNRSSAAFADVACGDVTAMLSGSIDTPFNSTSNFASIEVPRFKASRVKKLNVVMVIQKNAISNCNHPSLKNLRQSLDTGITYSCKDVSESRIQECGAKPEIACGACW
ncbi:ADP-ribosyl cyclase/cyclic ADP-ribose hydrolase 1 isoform X2 [Oreochromis niloticus]|uniref:ADP-ribosyl cyclase/cyclic ADP-ribose hydrolase 1 isoform X2 n=1 Tax=Oreochromis niloticus TaxID=8128 RepID=UPI00022AF38A|nr:ADP-ribosyl cyclase/cyclic ADP-ribose hydrolase 1 isoform X2 [Oreochromis niloticus]